MSKALVKRSSGGGGDAATGVIPAVASAIIPGVGKLIKQSGGRGQYGHVEVDVRPGSRSSGLVV